MDLLGLGLAVVMIVGLAGAKAFHLHVGHTHAAVAVHAGEVVASPGCSSGAGCCGHGVDASAPESKPADDPCDGHEGGCDHCATLASLGATTVSVVSIDRDTSVVEWTSVPQCTSRDVWGCTHAISRGPPRRFV